MSATPYYLHGFVVDFSTDARVPDVVVRLLGQQGQRWVPLATTRSQADGDFHFFVPKGIGKISRLKLTFFRDDQEMKVREGEASWQVSRPPVDFVYRVEQPEAAETLDEVEFPAPTEDASVRGRVRHLDGTPAEGLTIQVFRRQLGVTPDVAVEDAVEDEILTDEDGIYILNYEPITPAPHLYLVVSTPGDEVVARSKLFLSVPDHLRVDFTISHPAYRKENEYARLDAAISPLLVGQTLSELVGDDAVLLSAQLRIPFSRVSAYLTAQRLAEVLSPTPPAALYGLVRQGLPTRPHRLAAMRPALLSGALHRAAARNQIAQSVAADAATIIDQMRDHSVDLAVAPGGRRSMGKLLQKGAPSLSSDQREAFVRHWLANRSSMPDFWAALAADTEVPFTSGDVAAAQRATQMGILTLHHPPLMTAFDTAYPSAAVSKTAELTAEDWVELMEDEVDGQPVFVPEGIAGEDAEEKRENYASLLVQQAEAAFPSAALGAAIRRTDPGDTTDLAKFVRDNSAFEFGRTPVDTFLASEEADLDDIDPEDVPALTKRLKRYQRLFRLAPSFDRHTTLQAMEDAGLQSALSIARLGRKRFLQAYGDQLPSVEIAGEVYARAKTAAAMAQVLYVQHQPQLMKPELPSLPKQALSRPGQNEAGEGQLAEYEQLFDPLSLCACEECQTILSPAAYFVDLLQWLEEKGSHDGGARGYLEGLNSRRPDLGEMKLSCDNTNRALPYIDLAIEILEAGVINEYGEFGTATVPTETTLTTEELLAHPEHLVKAVSDPPVDPPKTAYDVLKEARGPLGLPFHFPLAQIRPYLAHIGIAHADFLEMFQSPYRPLEAELDLAFLQLSPSQAEVLLEASGPGSDLYELWGYHPDGSGEVPHPVDSVSVPWPVALRYLPEFLSRAEIRSFEDLLDLLHTRYVNGEDRLDLTGEGCEVEGLFLGQAYPSTPLGNTPNYFDFQIVQIFLRLQRVLGWSPLDLDKVLAALNVVPDFTTPSTGITSPVLQKLSYIHRLQKRTEADLTAMASWWSVLDTWLDRGSKEAPVPSLYDRLFLNASRGNPTDTSAISLFQLHSDRSELLTPETSSSTANLLGDHEAELLAAFNTTADELREAASQVVDELALAGTEWLARRMDHLWRLFRRIHFAQTVGLTVHEVGVWSGALSLDPFTSPKAAYAWIDALEELRARGWTVQEVAWVLLQDEEAARALHPTDAGIQELLGTLREELRAIEADASAETAPDEASTRLMLADLLSDADTVDALVAIVGGSEAATSYEDQQAQRTTLEENLSAYVSIEEADSYLVSLGKEGYLPALREGVIHDIIGNYSGFFGSAAPGTESLARRALAALSASVASGDIDDLVASIDGTSTESEATQSDLLTTNLGAYIDAEEATNRLIDVDHASYLPEADAGDVAGRFRWFLSALATTQEASVRLAVSALATTASALNDIVDVIDEDPEGTAAEQEALLANNLSDYIDIADAVAHLIDDGDPKYLSEAAERFAWFLGALNGQGRSRLALHALVSDEGAIDGIVDIIEVTSALSETQQQEEIEAQLSGYIDAGATFKHLVDTGSGLYLSVTAPSPLPATEASARTVLAALLTLAGEEFLESDIDELIAIIEGIDALVDPEDQEEAEENQRGIFEDWLSTYFDAGAGTFPIDDAYDRLINTEDTNYMPHGTEAEIADRYEWLLGAVESGIERVRAQEREARYRWFSAAVAAGVLVAWEQRTGARYSWFLSALSAGVTLIRKQEQVRQRLSLSLNVPKDALQELQSVSFDDLVTLGVTDYVAAFTDAAFTAVSDAEIADDPWSDLTRESEEEVVTTAFVTIDLLARVAHLFRALDLDADHLAFWLEKRSALSLLDLSDLPASEDIAALPTLWAGLDTTIRLFALREALPGQEPDLSTLLGGLRNDALAAIAPFEASLVERTGWSEADLDGLIQLFAFNSASLTIIGFNSAVVMNLALTVTRNTSAGPVNHTIPAVISSGGTESAALVALRNAILADTVVGGAAGANQQITAICIDSAGNMTGGAGSGVGSGADAQAVRVTATATTNVPITFASTTLNVLLRPLSVKVIEKLAESIALLEKMGTTAEKALSWVQPDPTQEVADAVRLAASARYSSTSAWSPVGRSLRDQIRPLQQDALVRWLVVNSEGVDDEIDLYSKYLIDVQMSPCMLTSRIKQGISSVQQFILRGFLGLEDGIEFNEEDAETWEWMKSYRVWEAARKIFLYPEKWIEPELRQQKSVFFTELESEIQQGEMTEERAEAALTTYLEKVHDLSNPFVTGLYHEYETGIPPYNTTIDTLHMFAQTRAAPVQNWYRRREDGYRWTPWEKVDLDIATRHVAPVVFARRLMVFWPEFRRVQSEEGNEYFEIALSWSERLREGWSPKRTSEAMVPDSDLIGNHSAQTDFVNITTEEDLYCIKTSTNDVGNLRIEIVYRLFSTNSWSETIVGVMELDACTWELISADQSTDSESRAGPSAYTNEAIPYSYYQGYKIRYGETLSMPIRNQDIGEDYDGTTLFIGRADIVDPVSDDEPGSVPENERLLIATVPHHYTNFVCQSPFVIQENDRAYLISPKATTTSAYQSSLVMPNPGKTGHAKAKDFGTLYVSDAGTYVPAEPSPFLVDYIPSDTEEDGAIDIEGEKQALSNANTSPEVGIETADGVTSITLTAEMLHIPYICDFLREVRYHGVMGLLAPDQEGTYPLLVHQEVSDPGDFSSVYEVGEILTHTPVKEIVFDPPYSPQGIYNWEIFFHIPFYMAARLSENMKFDEAMQWYHTIFDPRKGLELAWQIKPLIAVAETPVTDWAAFTGANGDEDAAQKFNEQVATWLENPFDPHAVAQLRPDAYRKAIVRKYLDNLIAWGDERFTVDTLETINEAIQLYMYAYDLLGKRPVEVTATAVQAVTTYNLLAEEGFDNFSNVLIDIETLLASSVTVAPTISSLPLPLGQTAYFCIPRDEYLLQYWDILDDRLYKIRNCMNIDGVVRTLPLFEPPLDPGALVRAAASGADLSSVLRRNELLPTYRFMPMLQTARTILGSVTSLGGALLSALEKKDAEEISLLRSNQEISLLEAARTVRKLQVAEAEAALDGAEQAKTLAAKRESYYQGLIDQNMLPSEEMEESFLKEANNRQIAAQIVQSGASALHSLGEITFKATSPPEYTIGGSHLANAATATATVLSMLAGQKSFEANRNARKAARVRRKQEWKFQVKQAKQEQKQHEASITAAKQRLEAARQELTNHDTQVRHQKEVNSWMRSKFTSQQLYSWMVGQIGSLYAQSYQLALAVSRKAEQSFRHELGLTDSAYVRADHWDSLKKGLLAGERLQQDLNRMEAAYLDGNRREFEITKNISLNLLDSLALVRLREEGECFFNLPEALFDLDFPGHYFRRIRGLSVTIPCVTSAYGGVNAQLTLVSSTLRRAASSAEEALMSDAGRTDSIVLSGAANDSGMFSFDFNDPRFLPFERRGVSSTWRLRLTDAIPQFDRTSISDVVLQLRYTALDGGDAFAAQVRSTLEEQLNARTSDPKNSGTPTATGLLRAFSMATDFSDAWYRFLHPTGSAAETLTVPLTDGHFPHAHARVGIKISKVELFFRLVSGASGSAEFTLTLNGLPPDEGTEPALNSSATVYGLPYAVSTWSGSSLPAPGTVQLIRGELISGLTPLKDKLEDLLLVFHYTLA